MDSWLDQPIQARGPVESWLAKVDASIGKTLKRFVKMALESFAIKNRMRWITAYPAQIVLAVIQQQWAKEIENILTEPNVIVNKSSALKLIESKVHEQMHALQEILWTEMGTSTRNSVGNIIRALIYARDITGALIADNVQNP